MKYSSLISIMSFFSIIQSRKQSTSTKHSMAWILIFLSFFTCKFAYADIVEVSMTGAPNPVQPGELVQYALLAVSNDNLSTSMFLSAQVPAHTTVPSANISSGGSCGASVCTAGQTIEWGGFSTAPGQAIAVQFSALLDTANPPSDGTVIRATGAARSSGGGAAITGADVVVSNGGATLGMLGTPSAVVPGDVVNYVLTFGNSSGVDVTEVVLAVPLPAGTTLVSASNSGTVVGSEVQWNLGSLATGATGQRQFIVQVNETFAPGTLLSVAELRTSGAGLAQGTATVAVQATPSVQVSLTGTSSPVQPGELVQYALLAVSNDNLSTSMFLSAQVPAHTTVPSANISSGGSCGASVCTAGQTIEWGGFSTAPGQAIAVQFSALLDTAEPPSDGTVIRATGAARSSGGGAAITGADVVVSNAGASLEMLGIPSAVVPGDVVNYVLTFGNSSGVDVTEVVLAVPLPAGTTLVSASNSGTVVGSEVQWNLGSLATGATGQRQFIVQVNETFAPGTLLSVAELRTSGTGLAQGTATVAVQATPSVQVSLTGTSSPVQPGELVQYALLAVSNDNLSTSMFLSAQVPAHTTVPSANISSGGSCGASICTAGQTIEWGGFSTAPGQAIAVQFSALLDTADPPSDGTVIRATGAARSSGGGAAVTGADVMVSIQWQDIDNDGIADNVDNCPNQSNTNQLNTDNDSMGNVCDSDDDNDGLPDSWETANELDPLDANDASLDADNDGASNLEEYQAGTDPQDNQQNPNAINLALDTEDYVWRLSGDTPWIAQNTEYHVGSSALQSGAIANYEQSVVDTTVIGASSISFYWKVSSESGADFLTFYIDNIEMDSISGEVDWQQKTFHLSPGSHTLLWIYSKDGSDSNGSDAAWLDGVSTIFIGIAPILYLLL